MSAYSIWPYFAVTALLLMLASTLLPGAVDTPPSPEPRVSAFDGLRGFLALAVFFHHGVTYHKYLLDGSWEIPASETFYLQLGKFGVAGFFMITGYLFWSRVINLKGRLDWCQLYIGRLFRIGPLYLIAAALMLVFVFVHVGLHLNVPPFKLAKQIMRWLSLGLLHGYDIDGFGEATLLLGVAWTLQFEWYFYIILPVLAFILTRTSFCFYYCLGALLLSLIYIWNNTSASLFYTGLTYSEPIALFLAGMTFASVPSKGVIIGMPESLTSTIVGALVVFAFATSNFIHSAGEIILLGGAFYLITEGCSFFGLLTSRSARRLGNVSYGIYLFHLLVFASVFSIPLARHIAMGSPIGYWSMIFLCAVLLIVFATTAHVWIERPGIEFGKHLGGVVSGRFRTKICKLDSLPAGSRR